MANVASHDQNFKNLILDYPRDALAFFAAEEAPLPDDDVRIIPARQEQLQERLGKHYHELDVPLLVEWADTASRYAGWLTTASISPNCSKPTVWCPSRSSFAPPRRSTHR